MGFLAADIMKEYIAEVREFKQEYPDEWSSYLELVEKECSYRTRRAVELLVECETQKEALQKLAEEGLKMARATANQRIFRAKSMLRIFWLRHPLTLQARLEPSQVQFLEKSINAMLRPYGLELGRKNVFETVPVKKISGERFDAGETINIGELKSADNYAGETIILND